MDKRKHIAVFLPIFMLLACNTEQAKKEVEDKTFPALKELTHFQETRFLPTLETPFSTRHNGIYAASLLLAWEAVKNEISDPVISFDSEALEAIDNSDSYEGVLSDEEQSSSVEIDDLTIRAKAFFKKSLPFVIPLLRHSDPMFFLDDKVASFGFYGENEASRIAYYNNDSDFAIRLIPDDKEHEIILMKSDFADTLILKKEIERLYRLKKEFRTKRNEKNNWKYSYTHEDEVRIPVVGLHIETNFSHIEGTSFSTQNKTFLMDLMYQRIAFVLNERGAELESEADLAVTESMMEEELPKPKKMIFDGKYLLFLKRKDSSYPYFAMFVSNSELMEKQ